tara:strand:- start:846 stop:1400 length:555 start_codon:yes stop_codon:yes gene_type:complete
LLKKIAVNALKELQSLLELFPDNPPLLESAEHVAGSTTPEPYKSMLVHEHHMTVTMENYHQSSVEVQVLDRNPDESNYGRKILLLKEGTDEVVQFGIVRFNFEYVTEEVKQEIIDENIPLGRVLITHNVLRHIDLGAILKVKCGPTLAKHFNCEVGTETYGRLATIFCNNRPAVDLLEISSPLS